jgi:ribose 5-phosphate isomerase B
MSTKRFDIITEADARVLEPGSTVELVRGGQVTPLAADTLRARQIEVLRDDGVSVDEADLPAVAPIRTVAIGSDHTGVSLRRDLIARLRSGGVAVHDFGTECTTPVDYPDIAASVARAVASREADAGVIIDSAGTGSAIAANKIDGIRAAMCTDVTVARSAREHSGSNVLCLGASLLTGEQAAAILDAWMEAVMHEPRYVRRLAKIRTLERSRR